MPQEAETVFDISRGLSAVCWKAVRWMYVLGASGGPIGSIYGSLRRRTNYNDPGILQKLLGGDIRRHHAGERHPLVVSHPLLVGILRGRQGLLYQHGELVVPDEARVRGAESVFVPTEEVAATFRHLGYADSQVVVTGLCLEPGIVAQAQTAWELRSRRLAGREPLTGIFISSGAEPTEHVKRLALAALSAVRSGGRIIALARQHGRLERSLTDAFAAESLNLVRLLPGDSAPTSLPAGVLALYDDREQENRQAARLFPHFDYLVCPPHERSNWALGLGLPMFAVTPTIGTFAPLNLRLLIDSGVAQELGGRDESASFGVRLAGLAANGTLPKMAQAGWKRYDIHGFSTIATWLAKACSSP